jgi:hypothetical protein
MKIKLLFIFALMLVSFCGLYSQTNYYLGKYLVSKNFTGIILEDHVTYNRNINSFGESDLGVNFINYENHIRSILTNQFSVYSDTGIYFSPDYSDAFEKNTDIKTGETFNISCVNGVYSSVTTGYVINLEDIIGGGVMFYVAVKMPENVSFEPDETVILSKNPKISQLTTAKMQDDFVVDKFKKAVWKYVKNIEAMDMNKPNGKWSKIKSIDSSDISVFKGSFTGKGKDEYLVTFKKKVAFDAFASVTYIMNSEGKKVKTVFELMEKDFNYSEAVGVCDIDGDGRFEILAETGYYEGMSLSVWKLGIDGYKMIASGFFFGV